MMFLTNATWFWNISFWMTILGKQLYETVISGPFQESYDFFKPLFLSLLHSFTAFLVKLHWLLFLKQSRFWRQTTYLFYKSSSECLSYSSIFWNDFLFRVILSRMVTVQVNGNLFLLLPLWLEIIFIFKILLSFNNCNVKIGCWCTKILEPTTSNVYLETNYHCPSSLFFIFPHPPPSNTHMLFDGHFCNARSRVYCLIMPFSLFCLFVFYR